MSRFVTFLNNAYFTTSSVFTKYIKALKFIFKEKFSLTSLFNFKNEVKLYHVLEEKSTKASDDNMLEKENPLKSMLYHATSRKTIFDVLLYHILKFRQLFEFLSFNISFRNIGEFAWI